MAVVIFDRVTDDELAVFAERARARAARGVFDGRMHPKSAYYFDRCRHLHSETGTQLIFTRDIGHHTSGWLKNPDYERCYHLSLSFFDGETGERAPQNRRLSGRWAKAFYGQDVRLAWVEPSASHYGKRLQVWHWRLFCDEHWQPIHPRGEVYSTELTELGWKSASQVMEETGVEIYSPREPG